MAKSVVDELREILRPFIKEQPLKKDSVYEEDMEMLISEAKAFQVEEKLLEEIKAHPDWDFWSFGACIPQGVPAGPEDILEDDEDD